MKLIPLTRGRFAMVDDCDFERVSEFKWHLRITGRNNDHEYAIRWVGTRPNHKWIRMHRFILGVDQTVDHVDGNGLNNIRSNLRVCNLSQNNANRRVSRKSATGFKGVHWKPMIGKYVARIKNKGRQFHLGVFTNKRKAALAYDRSAIKLFGSFARTNIMRVCH